ncbi:hypothetical protein EDD66_101351 [Mobilisporobacter senegalensis]|uniref:Pre-peptidase n=1 Tax=Mobilisporobacter senegalensis TaxID=1329262 RepID=A0A3N1XYQ1_9FIRM|nr:hypothetical protein [Mobilisporobacter senegalensis]ROR31733.1 hypothetical protein EDD66_101351 [Mobilisporobacter senegalensis]
MAGKLKFWKKGITILFLCGLMLIAYTINAKASSWDISLTPSYVPDIDNILYPSTSQYYVYDGLQGVGSFTIKQPTIIKAYFNWDATTSNSISGQAWFSRDRVGVDVIGSMKRLSKPGDSILIFLDPGTYYVNHLFSVKNNSDSSFLRVGVALLAEDAKSEESIVASSYTNANRLTLNESRRGFLSTIAPIDYYQFTINSKSEVTIGYNFEQTNDVNVGSGVCTLYDNSNQKITSKNFSTNGSSYNKITQILDKGTYYISLSGTTCATTIEVNGVSYSISVSHYTGWTKKNISVTVSTEFEPYQILYVNQKVGNVKITDATIWNTYINKNCREANNNKFTVTKNGYYTIRIRDKNNNYILKSFYVKNIDKLAPTVTGVANKKTYKTGMVVRFSDKHSGIKRATLNGRNFKSGSKVTKKGTYTLKVYDKAGNVKTVVFYIK